MTDRWATFDCYGTLIDWDGGVRRTLVSVWPEQDETRLFHAYHDVEPRVQADRGTAYRQVLRETLAGVAELEELEVPPGQEDALSEALPSWRPFHEVPDTLQELRDHGWRLAILSNTDPDLLEASLKTIGVEVDVRITAAEAGAYKPNHAHWDTFFRTTGADRAGHVHVAASLYHDVEPCAKLGLPCVWINRRGESSDLPRVAELPTLAGLPSTVARLVPR
ncbi:MAG TPA: HAD-IA family hydrolase [Actinomycetota bacterium]|nr:HAD-IA family hydrolase [Actinomycetota bacterium]